MSGRPMTTSTTTQKGGYQAGRRGRYAQSRQAEGPRTRRPRGRRLARRPCRAYARRASRASLFGDFEAEHHAALVVLRDVAVRHPDADVRHVEQDVDGLTRSDQDGVLPDEVRLRHVVAAEDQEA